ncbi:SIR2 family protein [Tautonia marina]|uniref:SIR2 family protein n=1 Tax=Tautonia marina TaxID=2653855 RepID=UPI00126057B9|nr:SIR2 family protein [Tautonia marina]
MSEIGLPEFYDNYVKSLTDGTAALFAGAGLSRPAGFVDWKGLMREIASDLHLDIDIEYDLIAIAQYHLNKRRTRATLNRKLVEEYTEDVRQTENHKLIANLPIRTVWTTNYDKLIENAYEAARKRVEVKTDPKNLVPLKRRVDAMIYKMHGDVSSPDNAVLTKEDYELYNVTRQAFTQVLESDLISKTFLFLGFSFTDPNIDYILSRIRVLVGTGRDHYCIMRREPKRKGLRGKQLAEYEYAQRKQQLRIDDLGRYNIRTILVDEYAEVTGILKELNRRVHLNDIFVSGSAFDYAPRGQEEIEKLSRRIGEEIINNGYNLISGFGLGIGSFVIVGSMEAVYRDDTTHADDRLVLRPFPQGNAPAGMTVQDFWEKYRRDMLSKAGFAIFLCGNKQDGEGKPELAGGVMQEFEIAKQLGVYPIPVGATGHASREIWNIVNDNIDDYYPGFSIKTNFKVLGNEKSSNDDIIEAIFAIIKRVRR